MKVAFVHDWLINLGGSEKVLEALLRMYPSKIYTLIADQSALIGTFLQGQQIETSFIQKLPRAKTKYRSYLPLFPLAVEQFDLFDYDLVISSSHSIAKGALTHADQLHICYCHTPMRYAWDFYQQSLRRTKLKSGVKGVLAKCVFHYLRMWDMHASKRVDVYVANSHCVGRRIQKLYRQAATVIYPPVKVEHFSLCETKEHFYLTASRLVPDKRVELIVEAFQALPDQKLVVIGEGSEMKRIKKKARRNVEILGYQNDEILKQMLQRARAFICAAVEDFGILPVEAQSCGTPVIAFGKGGVLETVIEGKTGLFYPRQCVASLVEAIQKFERRQGQFVPAKIHAHAQSFSTIRFQREFETFVKRKYEEFIERYSWKGKAP